MKDDDRQEFRQDALRAAIGCGVGSMVLVVVLAAVLLALLTAVIFVFARHFNSDPVNEGSPVASWILMSVGCSVHPSSRSAQLPIPRLLTLPLLQ